MSKWLVELIGDPKDLQFISQLLNSTDLNIFAEQDIYYLATDKLNPTKSDIEIKALVDSLIDIINGAAILYYPRFKRISYRQFHKLHDNGERQTFGFLHASHTDTMFYAFGNNNKLILNWLEIGQKNSTVGRVFTLYGALEHNWRNLYMVLDVLEEDLNGEENLKNQNWVEKSKVELFKRTANSYIVLGKDARHARTLFKPPQNPMSIQDAQVLFDSLLKEWLQYKLRKQST